MMMFLHRQADPGVGVVTGQKEITYYIKMEGNPTPGVSTNGCCRRLTSVVRLVLHLSLPGLCGVWLDGKVGRDAKSSAVAC